MANEKINFKVQVLESLGAPLMSAIEEVAVRQGGGADRSAETMAALLGRAVQTGLALGQSLQLNDTDGQGDAARVALAAVAARLVAGQYTLGGKVPDEAAQKRIGGAMDAVLSFADNFTAGAEGRGRLALLGDGRAPAAQPDETQIALQYVAAMVPVVSVISAFSFGRPEKKLLQDVAGRLSRDAEDLCRDLCGDALGAGAAARAELSLLRVLAEIYAACHRSETARLSALSPEDREKAAVDGAMPMEPVWDAYGARLAMLGVLGAQIAGTPAAQDTKAPVPPQAPSQAQSMPVAPAAPPAPPPPAKEEAGESADDGTYNPMSFFGGGNKNGGDKKDGGKGDTQV